VVSLQGRLRRKGRHVPEERGAEHDVGDVGVALDGVGLVGTMPARVISHY
jgi:hypothetical protein